jgi:hypothetical protein
VQKMNLGAATVRDLGNLCSAAAPVWIAAGFEEAADRDMDPQNAISFPSPSYDRTHRARPEKVRWVLP